VATTPEICPNCGAELPQRARACPECGADEATGWSENAGAEHLELPGEQFDYDDFVRREFGSGSPKPRGIKWFWWVTAVVVLIGMVIWLIR
jgi:hypothetical protein